MEKSYLAAAMSPKTQVVTIALAAQSRDVFGVVGGSTVGMMLADVLVIYLASRLANRLHPKAPSTSWRPSSSWSLPGLH